MLVYLFRQRCNRGLALTTDVTGRNLPSHTPDKHWVFIEVIDVEKTRPPLGIADPNDALSRVRDLGLLYLLKRSVKTPKRSSKP